MAWLLLPSWKSVCEIDGYFVNTVIGMYVCVWERDIELAQNMVHLQDIVTMNKGLLFFWVLTT
jgi:hypothetical protein